METRVFSNFADYWHLAKFFTKKQRHAILRSMPKVVRESIEKSYADEGWEDLLFRNRLDERIDSITAKYGWNLLELRCLVLSGKAVYVTRAFWEHVNTVFKGYEARHLFYIFGGYRVVESENGRDEYKLVPVEGR